MNVEFSFISTQAASNLVYVNYFVEINFLDGTKAIQEISNLIKGPFLLPKDVPLSFNIILLKIKDVKLLNIALIGEYTTEDNGNNLLIRDAYMYTLSTHETLIFPDKEKQLFFEKYNIR